ncbi:preprotein translocase subunit YajC [uncultured Finegoldia sp.]|uniref:preprotein translocase subunit YajC n=1 Tax=uncultured Finegoldia sp. TaxID=328009 RepID=UPI00261423DD|nr:preprotein translocase subunit YajC [uncultured Finegoldia sp.]
MPKMLASLLPLIALFGVMYFLMIRPQQKQQKQLMEMRNAIKVGDEVITIGGIKGTVVALTDDTVVLETSSQKTRIEFVRNAIASNVKSVVAKENKKEEKEVK